MVGPVHDRMPVILEPEDYERWLDPRPQRPEGWLSLLRPYPGERMVASPVGRLVNDPRHDDPRCVEPLA